MPGALRIAAAECATRIVEDSTEASASGTKRGLVAVDVHEHPLRAPGLAIEIDLAHAAQPLPARVEDVATGPFAVVPELGL